MLSNRVEESNHNYDWPTGQCAGWVMIMKKKGAKDSSSADDWIVDRLKDTASAVDAASSAS